MIARKLLVALALSLTAFVSTSAFAQAPAGSTGECKDGTYTSAKSKRGACAGHGGVKTWFADAKGAPSSAKPSASTATASEAPAGKPSPAAKEPAPAAKTSAKSEAAPVETKEGAGPGMVWVNTPSGVYHCSGDQWYGKTKKGEYMSESQAKSRGYRASRNKPCS
jgi:hypothetical protein